MDSKIVISFNSLSDEKLSIISENLNILKLDDNVEINEKIREDMIIILYAYKKLIDVSYKRGIIGDKDEIMSKLEEISTLIG